VKTSSQGVMSSKKANHDPGLCPIKEKSPLFALGLGPKINSQACLWVLPRPCHLTQCWLSNQRLILLLIIHLETPKDGPGTTNSWTEPSLASLSAISFPRTPTRPGTQYSPTVCTVEITFNDFRLCCTNGDVVLAAWRAFRTAWLSEQILTYFSGLPGFYDNQGATYIHAYIHTYIRNEIWKAIQGFNSYYGTQHFL
jgi:hypothetical protein